jgi:hypothetical protein
MQPTHYRFGGGGSATLLNPLVAVGMILAIILIFVLPRRQVIIPLLLAIFLVPKGQELVAAGLHFNVYRIILITGLIRWFRMRRTCSLPGGFSRIDRVVMWCVVAVCICFSLEWHEPQAVIKAVGDLLDALAGYFVLRFFIRDRDDIKTVISVFALIAIIMGVEMINEQRTRQNFFGQLGGTLAVPEMRDGKIRSQGAFRHAIPAGAFGATLVPMLVWLWSDRRYRKIVPLGLAGATVMAITCHSSSDTGSYAAGLFALCLWPMRRRMRFLRYGIVAALVLLQLVMKGPVWSVLEHINLTGSSESFHRYQLINTFINHFWDWCLIGTKDNGSWGWEMADTSNQYVTYGIAGGLTAFCLFIMTISRSFGGLGRSRKLVEGRRSDEWLCWCLGASLFAYVVVYFGIDLFDQLEFAWFSLLAMINVVIYQSIRASRHRLPVQTATQLPDSEVDLDQLVVAQ